MNEKQLAELNIPTPDQIQGTQKELREKIQQLNQQRFNQAKTPEAAEPTPAESDQPIPAETQPKAAEQEAQQQAVEGIKIPFPAERPTPEKNIQQEGSVIVAQELAGQLGTSPEIRAQMRIDERKLAVLDEGTLAALSHFSYRFVYDKIRYFGHITEWWLTGSQGLHGLGRRHILQALANTSGIQVMDKASKPNAIARNIWKRDWKQEAEAQGKIVDE